MKLLHGGTSGKTKTMEPHFVDTFDCDNYLDDMVRRV